MSEDAIIHEIDPLTEYCKRCGKHVTLILSVKSRCRDDVVAISHIVRAKAEDDRLKKVLAEMDGA